MFLLVAVLTKKIDEVISISIFTHYIVMISYIIEKLCSCVRSLAIETLSFGGYVIMRSLGEALGRKG